MRWLASRYSRSTMHFSKCTCAKIPLPRQFTPLVGSPASCFQIRYTHSGYKEALKAMLGDQIGEETGKVLVIRVLDSAALKAEASTHTTGKLLGIDYQGRTTYTST